VCGERLQVRLRGSFSRCGPHPAREQLQRVLLFEDLVARAPLHAPDARAVNSARFEHLLLRRWSHSERVRWKHRQYRHRCHPREHLAARSSAPSCSINSRQLKAQSGGEKGQRKHQSRHLQQPWSRSQLRRAARNDAALSQRLVEYRAPAFAGNYLFFCLADRS
jgi:hypothetical protein